ncbi:flagellar hook-associated protein FlgL [Chromatiaceae bacterium AAb-1]|nr:flagellar hook-associated protein FlgL [Chromatiaceae bacterium AAb-1]
MRVSSHQYHLNTIRTIQQNTEEYSKTSIQLATNRRILKPSDDPLGAVMLLTLDSELTTLKQYTNNMSAVNYNLGQQETHLNSIVNLLGSMQELATTAANDSNSAYELEAFGQEMEVLFQGIVDALNAKDGTGRYYFSGSEIDVVPFQFDAVTNTFSYEGDEQVRQVAVSDTSSVASNILGSNLAPNNAEFLNEMRAYLDFLATSPDTAGDESRAAIDSIGSFLGNVAQEITRIGGITASLDELETGNTEISLFTENLRDDIRNVDYPTAYVHLNETLAAYESSLRVYASVTKLSLFSYI